MIEWAWNAPVLSDFLVMQAFTVAGVLFGYLLLSGAFVERVIPDWEFRIVSKPVQKAVGRIVGAIIILMFLYWDIDYILSLKT